jgi:hypothetical protein
VVMPQQRHLLGQRICRGPHPIQPPDLEIGDFTSRQRCLAQCQFSLLKFNRLGLSIQESLDRLGWTMLSRQVQLGGGVPKLRSAQQMSGIASGPGAITRGIDWSQQSSGWFKFWHDRSPLLVSEEWGLSKCEAINSNYFQPPLSSSRI